MERIAPSLIAAYKRASATPLRCVLFEAYKMKVTGRKALAVLLSSIRAGTFRPVFPEAKIDKLFKEKVLKAYANGRYLYHEKLDTLGNWNDLLNNIACAAVYNHDFLKEPEYGPEERQEIFTELKTTLKQIKIIEDWLFYHPEEQQKVSWMLLDNPTTT